MVSGRKLLTAGLVVMVLGGFLGAQQSVPLSSAGVPRLVNFSSRAVDAQGKTITGIAGATFAIYKDQSGGTPLWMETQNVQADAKGSYTVQLGATMPDGLPLDLFTSGEARWLGVTINGGEEQPRILLLSVPYALKAADAETVGGLPASAFVLANKPQENAPATLSAPTPKAASNATRNTAPPPVNSAVTGIGAAGFLPVWDSASDIVDSVISQKNLLIGINTANPGARLDVNGKSHVRDTLTLFPKSTNPTLVVNGTAFSVASTGQISFAAGQTFPGTPLLAANNAFAGDQLIAGNGAAYGLTVTSPNYLALNLQGPETGVGAGLEITTTGTGGLSWQILNTGTEASQGANKLNFRNDSAGRDVMSLTATGDVSITGNAVQPRTSNGMAKAMVYVNGLNPPYSIVRCFNSALSGSAATTPPCGINFTESSPGIWFLDFGYEVDDRFLSATTSNQQCIEALPWSTTVVEVVTQDCNFNYNGSYFYLIVY